MLTRTSGIIVPKDHREYEKIKSDLHRFIQTFFNGGYEEKYFYKELEDGSILIPRYYPVTDEIIDVIPDGEDIEIENLVVPRNNRQTLSINFMVNEPNGILRLEPGSGKTVISCAAIATIKKRTIIIVHKEKLIEQWKKELLTHTDLKPEYIGILSSQNYKKCLNCKIILSTPQVIAYAAEHNKFDFMEALKNANIGLMIVDECHISGGGAEKFALASLYINCKRVKGLSATPERSDGQTDLIHFHLGEVKYFEPDKDDLIKPNIHMVYFPFGCYSNYKNYIYFGGRFNLARYYKQLGKKGIYNRVIGKWINDAYNKGRNILILGKNISPLLDLCRESNIPKEDVGIFVPGAVDGHSKEKEPKVSKKSTKKKPSEEKAPKKPKKINKHNKTVDELSDTYDLMEAFHSKKVVFSTYLSGRDGNSRDDLNCLFMVTPTSNIEQAVGRIQRKHEGKTDVIVMDFVDTEGPEIGKVFKQMRGNTTPLFEYMAQKRLKIYEEKGWEVKIHKLEKKEKLNEQ